MQRDRFYSILVSEKEDGWPLLNQQTELMSQELKLIHVNSY